MREGVMIFSPFGYAIACRKGKDILVYKESFGARAAPPQMGILSRFPFLRGIFVFIFSLGMSIRAYIITHKLSSGEEGTSKTSFARDLFLQILLNLFLGFIILILLPDLLVRSLSPSFLLMSSVETMLRIAFFLLYVVVLSFFPFGKQLLQYHGAEHKTINAFESGAELVPEEVENYPRFHSRCGTTLFALVLLLLFFFYLPLQYLPFSPRVLLKILRLPLAFPIAFELVYLALGDKRFSFFLLPGLWLQRVTTKSPSREQLEVAIIALKEVVPIA